jgi:ribosomal protein S18 acetylase RimI-like enzyme
MKIRRATTRDADALARIHIDSWRSAYRGLVPDLYLDSLDYAKRAERFRESLAGNAEETYLAERHGEISGFLILGDCRDPDVDKNTIGEIRGIYLAPGHWRRGTGTLLCRHGEQILNDHGYRSAILWVFAGNMRARRFYEAMGYKADGASKMLNPGAPLKAVRYRKELVSPEESSGMSGQTEYENVNP